ncbi:MULTISPECIES: hypothetical protein [Bacteroides]|jgi:hypothetical protein|uniref:hypothetical protein n=1 Tax=Bacteroides TaxID=816 RepID=UPI0023F0E1B0|nr:hypothetical protein [Bacteroides graminisolvens]
MKKIIFAAAMVAMMCAGNVVYAQVKKSEPVKTEQTASKKAESSKKACKETKAKKAESAKAVTPVNNAKKGMK